jgi:putative ABC transport system permease protein
VAFAVAASSAVVVAMNCAVETAFANMHERVARFIGKADARIVHRHEAPFDPELIGDVRGWPGVVAVSGRVHGSLTLERSDGVSDAQGRPRRATVRCRGGDLGTEPAFAQVTYTRGAAPAAAKEIGIDPLAAKALDADIGTRLRLVRFGEPMEFIVSGIYERPALGALQRPSAQLDRTTLVDAAGLDDGVVLVSIALDEEVDPTAWIEANRARVAPPLRLESTEAATTGLDSPARVGTLMVSIITMLAFLCCSIIAATAMTTSIAQQQRELAIARCVGASRGQLFASQVLAGVVVCACAGVLGIPVGLLIAFSVSRFFASELPLGLSLAPAGPLLALAGSIGAGILGAIIPAWRASRVCVLHALTPHAQPWRRQHLIAFAAVAAACLLAQLALLLPPDPQARLWLYLAIGLPLLHAGWFLGAVPVLSLVAVALARLLERTLALPPALLRMTCESSGVRMGLVSGALMVGVAVLVASWTSGRAMLEEVTAKVRFGDAFAFKSTGFTAAEVARIRALPGVGQCAAVGYHPVEVQGERLLGIEGISTRHVVCIGFDVEPFLAMNRLEWIAGDQAYAARRLREGDAILVAKEFLEAKGIRPGDTLSLGRADHHRPFEVVGVVGAAGLDVATQYFGIQSLYMEHALSCVFMDFDAVARHFDSRDVFLIQMSLPAGTASASDEAIRTAVEDAAPGAVFASARAIREEIIGIGSIILTVCSSVAGGVLLLASLAGGAVIAAGVSARAREFGILEAVGASSSMVARLVVGEATLMGVTAALVGCAFGWHLAWMESRTYHDLLGLELHPEPHWRIALVASVAVTVSAIGASLPTIFRLLRAAPARLLSAS